MPNGGDIDINFLAGTASFTKGEQAVIKGLDGIKQHAQLTSNAIDKLRKGGEGSDFFEKVRENFGRTSVLGETTHLLEGKGPIAGLQQGAEILKNMTGEAAKLADEFREGKISAAGVADGLISGLPVVGALYDAYKNVNELITGDESKHKEFAELQKESAKVAVEGAKLQSEILKDNVKYAQEMKEFMEESAHVTFQATHLGKSDYDQDERRHEGAGYLTGKESERVTDQAQDRLDNLHRQSKAAIDEAQKAYDHATKLGKKSHDPLAGQAEWVALKNLQDEQAAEELKIEQDKQTKLVKIKSDGSKRLTAEDGKTADERRDRDLKQAEKDAKEIADAQLEAQSIALKAKGDTYGADRLDAQKAHEDRLKDIKKDADEQRKLFDGDNGRLDEVDQTQKQKEQAENTKHQALLDEINHKQTMDQVKTQEEAQKKLAEQQKQDQEKAASFIRENGSAWDKYMEKLREIDGEKGKPGITDDLLGKARKKADAEYMDSMGDKHVAALSRHFDFNMPTESKGSDPAQQALEQQKTQTDYLGQVKAGIDKLVNGLLYGAGKTVDDAPIIDSFA